MCCSAYLFRCSLKPISCQVYHPNSSRLPAARDAGLTPQHACSPSRFLPRSLDGAIVCVKIAPANTETPHPEHVNQPGNLRRHTMAMTLLGISGSLTAGGS